MTLLYSSEQQINEEGSSQLDDLAPSGMVPTSTSGMVPTTTSGMVPTSALTQDPETSRIWLSDESSGDILSCMSSPALTDCQVEVIAIDLGNGVAGKFLFCVHL